MNQLDEVGVNAADFEDLFRRAPFGYLVTTIEGVVTLVNDTVLDWIERDRDAVLGRDFGELLEPGSRLFYETRHRPTLLLSQAVDEVALTLLRADRTPIGVLANAAVIAAEDGRPAEVRIALLDSSQRQDHERTQVQARRVAEASAARSQVLQSSISAFISSITEIELAQRLVESAIGAFDAATATVLLDDGMGLLRSVAGAPRSPFPGDPVLEAFDTRVPIVVSGVEDAGRRFPAFAKAMFAERTDTLVAVPLLSGASALGVLVCTFGRTRRFDEDAISLHVALTLQAAQVLVSLRLQAKLERMALHDSLTGIANRRLIHDLAKRAHASALRSGRPLALVFLDLDGFKLVNDRFGHEIGDEVLKEVAARLRDAVRASDYVGRFGGDEFLAICEDADADAAAQIAERIRAAVGKPLQASQSPVTASVGVAVLTAVAGNFTSAELLNHADAAMYVSKHDGGNRVVLDVLG